MREEAATLVEVERMPGTKSNDDDKITDSTSISRVVLTSPPLPSNPSTTREAGHSLTLLSSSGGDCPWDNWEARAPWWWGLLGLEASLLLLGLYQVEEPASFLALLRASPSSLFLFTLMPPLTSLSTIL